MSKTLAEKFEEAMEEREFHWTNGNVNLDKMYSWLRTAEMEIREDERREILDWIQIPHTAGELGDSIPKTIEDVVSFLTSSKE